jgi:nitroimidazol reductase NimA-like FMN-containing flavoprotein (pyridoxamine 5'-phosphate oxidase superfamily)
LYGFTTPGQKIEWMRENPLVCVEVDEVTAHNQWVSVIAYGRFEELTKTMESDEERLRAWQVLKTHPGWGEPGCAAWAARARRDWTKPFVSVYYRIWIDRVTGQEATQEARDTIFQRA